MDAIDQLLGLDTSTELVEQEESSELVPSSPESTTAIVDTHNAPLDPVTEKQLEDDFQFARNNITTIVKTTINALDSATLLAQSGDSPRAYEVVGKLLESIVTANKELLDLHRAKKDTLTPSKSQSSVSLIPNQGQSPVNIGKAVFVGRASDLLRELKEIEKQQIREQEVIDAEVIKDSLDAHHE